MNRLTGVLERHEASSWLIIWKKLDFFIYFSLFLDLDAVKSEGLKPGCGKRNTQDFGASVVALNFNWTLPLVVLLFWLLALFGGHFRHD